MLKIRPEQLEVITHGVMHRVYRELRAELEAEYPDRDDIPTFLPDIVDLASIIGFSGRAEVKGLAHLMMHDPDELAGTFWSEFLQPVLFDDRRSGTSRLNFINRYLLPRIQRDRARGESGPPPLPEETTG